MILTTLFRKNENIGVQILPTTHLDIFTSPFIFGSTGISDCGHNEIMGAREKKASRIISEQCYHAYNRYYD